MPHHKGQKSICLSSNKTNKHFCQNNLKAKPVETPSTSCRGLLHPLNPPAPEKCDLMLGDDMGLGLPFINPSDSPKPWLGIIPETRKISEFKYKFKVRFFVIVSWTMTKDSLHNTSIVSLL